MEKNMDKHEITAMSSRLAADYLGHRLASRRAAIARAEFIAAALGETVVVVIWETNPHDFPDQHDHEYAPVLWETWQDMCNSLEGVLAYEHVARG
jgi:hypothetical protein